MIITPKIKVLSSLFQTGMTLFHLWKTRYLEEPLGPNSMKQSEYLFDMRMSNYRAGTRAHKAGGIYISIGGSAVVCVCGRGLGGGVHSLRMPPHGTGSELSLKALSHMYFEKKSIPECIVAIKNVLHMMKEFY